MKIKCWDWPGYHLSPTQQEKVRANSGQTICFRIPPVFVTVSLILCDSADYRGNLGRIENMGHEFFIYLKVAAHALICRVPFETAQPNVTRRPLVL